MNVARSRAADTIHLNKTSGHGWTWLDGIMISGLGITHVAIGNVTSQDVGGWDMCWEVMWACLLLGGVSAAGG